MLRRVFSRLAAAWRSLYTFDRPGCQVRLSIHQWLPFAILPLLLLWYLANPAPVAMMCMAALAGLIFLSYLWARSMARQVHGQRRLRYAAFQVGDELEEQVSLINDSILPVIWAEFFDTANLPGYTVTSVHSAESHATARWSDHTICSRRGLFRLGPWELRLGDPFGLFYVRQVYLEKNEVLVYPPLAPLPERLLPRGQVQGEERPLNQPLIAETQDAFTARPYQPGDALRHIHWPVTARHDYPHVRVFEPEASSTVWLVADLDASVHTGEGSDSSLENMIILLASLAAEMLRRRIAVGLLAYSGPGLEAEEDHSTGELHGPAVATGGALGTFPESPDRQIPTGELRDSTGVMRDPIGGLRDPTGVLHESQFLKAEMRVGDVPLVVTPQRGQLHLWDLLRALAVLTPVPGRSFSQLLARARMLVGGRDQVLAITPSLDPAWLGELYPFNRGRAGQGAGVILLDPASYGPITPADGAALASRASPGGLGQGGSPGGLGQGVSGAAHASRVSGADTFAALLTAQGIRTSVIRRGELHPVSGSYGEISRWEFKTLGTGRVYIRRAPKEISKSKDSDGEAV